jgi:hypothetical protein
MFLPAQAISAGRGQASNRIAALLRASHALHKPWTIMQRQIKAVQQRCRQQQKRDRLMLARRRKEHKQVSAEEDPSDARRNQKETDQPKDNLHRARSFVCMRYRPSTSFTA